MIRFHLWSLGLKTSGKSWEEINQRLKGMNQFINSCVAQGYDKQAVLAFIEHSHPEWRSYILELPIRKRHWWERWVKNG